MGTGYIGDFPPLCICMHCVCMCVGMWRSQANVESAPVLLSTWLRPVSIDPRALMRLVGYSGGGVTGELLYLVSHSQRYWGSKWFGIFVLWPLGQCMDILIGSFVVSFSSVVSLCSKNLNRINFLLLLMYFDFIPHNFAKLILTCMYYKNFLYIKCYLQRQILLLFGCIFIFSANFCD